MMYCYIFSMINLAWIQRPFSFAVVELVSGFVGAFRLCQIIFVALGTDIIVISKMKMEK